MKIIGVQSRAVSLAIAMLLLLPPVLTGAQGSRFPGLSAPSTETRHKHRRPVEVTFTKWVTTFPLMEGFTGGDAPGKFVGEVLERQVSQRLAEECYAPPSCGRVIKLEAMYEVQAGKHSFTALIRGGTSGDTGAAQLDGVILFGWRTGSRVHVEFQTSTSPARRTGLPCRTCTHGQSVFPGHDHHRSGLILRSRAFGAVGPLTRQTDHRLLGRVALGWLRVTTGAVAI